MAHKPIRGCSLRNTKKAKISMSKKSTHHVNATTLQRHYLKTQQSICQLQLLSSLPPTKWRACQNPPPDVLLAKRTGPHISRMLHGCISQLRTWVVTHQACLWWDKEFLSCVDPCWTPTKEMPIKHMTLRLWTRPRKKEPSE